MKKRILSIALALALCLPLLLCGAPEAKAAPTGTYNGFEYITDSGGTVKGKNRESQEQTAELMVTLYQDSAPAATAQRPGSAVDFILKLHNDHWFSYYVDLRIIITDEMNPGYRREFLLEEYAHNYDGFYRYYDNYPAGLSRVGRGGSLTSDEHTNMTHTYLKFTEYLSPGDHKLNLEVKLENLQPCEPIDRIWSHEDFAYGSKLTPDGGGASAADLSLNVPKVPVVAVTAPQTALVGETVTADIKVNHPGGTLRIEDANGNVVATPAVSAGGEAQFTFVVDASKWYSVHYTLDGVESAPAALAVAGMAIVKGSDWTYDGTEHSLLENKSLNTVKASVNGGAWQTLNLVNAELKTKNAGTYQVRFYAEPYESNFIMGVINLPGLASAADPLTFTVQVSPKSVTVSGITVEDKAYDGNTAAALNCSNAVFAGKIGGDTLSVTGTGTFSDANVGENKPVTITDLTLGGASDDNYVLAGSGQQTSATGTITPLPLADATVELSGPFTYDGTEKTVDVTVKHHGETLTAGADYTVSGTTSATDPSTGEGYAVTVTAAGNGNYSGSKTAYWKINPGEISGISASGYTGTYDSQYHGIDVQVTTPANATVTYREDENSSYRAEYPQYKDVGTYTVYYKVEADNYEPEEGSEQVVITAKEVTVSGITARDKVYDGTTDVELDCTNAFITGIEGTDDLSVLSAEGEFADENTGSNKTVHITSVTLGGADKGNYVIAASGSQTTATASITPRPLSEITLTLTPDTFVYDESEKSPSVMATFGGETLALSTDYIIDSIASVTEATAVSTGNGYPITVIANESGNYTGSQTAYWTITKGTMTGITADDVEETYDGTQYGIAVDNVPANAQVFYGESADDCTLTESPKYIDVGEYTVHYKVVKEGYYDFIGSAEVKISQKAQDAPPAPVVKADSITSSVIELEPVTVPGQGAVQYACSTTDTAPTDDGDWQSSPVFEGLSKDTRYYFFARYAGNRNYLTSPASAPAAQGETLDTYTIAYDLNTGSGTAPEEQTQDVGAAFTAAAQSGFQKSGYTFLGWATDAAATAAEYAAGTLVSGIGEDDTLYAVWKINPYTITFVTNGGTALAPVEGDYGTPVTARTTTRTGYSFGGWYEDTALTVPFVFTEGTTMPAKNLTLYAKWNALDGIVYTVNHHFEKVVSGYDTQSEQLSGVTGTDTSAQAKTVTGFTARSFNQSKIAGDGSTVVDIYYVRNLHILTFKPENGQDIVFSPVAYGAPITAPADPVRSGYTFNGWGEVASVMPDSDLTYTAKWTANTYSVTLNVNKGKIREGDVTEYTCGEGAVLPTNVTRSGYHFVGWYDNKELKGEPVSEITASEYGDKTYYAKWSMKTAEVPAYPPEIDEGKGGDVLISDKTPVGGQTVTIKPDPDKGYEVDEVIITDKDGDEIPVKENGDGTYSFKQPIGEVTITVTFAETECSGGKRCPAYAYPDVDTTQWYHEAVDCVLENGLMNGIGNGKFGPDETTSRAMIVTILWRLEGEPVVNYLMQFEDVPAETWYTEAVRWASAESIVNGYGDTFGPGDSITREQFATILWRYAKYKGYDVSVGGNTNILSYKDVFSISEYAIPAMQWACGAGLMQGDGVNLTPKVEATRAQAAALLMRFCELVK